jgi:hypothetical protein
MKVGAIVRSKNPNGQIKVPGKVAAILDAEFYLNYMMPKGLNPDIIWGKTCPNWKKEEVVIVFFATPQRTATLNEWVESGMVKGYSQKQLEREYKAKCPVTNTVVFPVADLEEVV